MSSPYSLIRFLFFIMLIGVLVGGSFFYQNNKAEQKEVESERILPKEEVKKHNSFFVDPSVVELIVSQAPNCLSDEVEPKLIKGGIANHHLLASELVSGFFCRVASRETKRVIVLAPNHFGLGGGWVIGGANNWSIGEQELFSDKEGMEKIASFGAATIDDGIFTKEHGIGNLMPAVKHFFPEAKVVTLVIKEKIPTDRQEKLISALKEFSDDQTMIIASLDFSHDLSLEEANAKDEQTLPILSGLDYGKISELNQSSEASNVDSPATLNIFLRVMADLGATDFELLGRGNSALISGQLEARQTTSYFTAVYSLKK